jgi:hypothetical protein
MRYKRIRPPGLYPQASPNVTHNQLDLSAVRQSLYSALIQNPEATHCLEEPTVASQSVNVRALGQRSHLSKKREHFGGWIVALELER